MVSQYRSDHQNYLLALRSMYDARSELMQESLARMDQLLSRELAREREMFEDDIATRKLEDWKVLSEEIYEVEGEEIVFGNAYFRRLMRRSNLVTIITFFESSLSEVTSSLLMEANTRRVGTAPGLRLRDFGRSNICDRCRTVLTKFVGITDNQKLWSRLKDLVKVRNAIVHQAGFIPVIDEKDQCVPEDKALRNAHKNLVAKGFSVLESGEMIVDLQLLDSVLEAVRDYLSDICNRAAEHYSGPKAVKN